MLLVISLIEDITSWVSISHYNGNNELVGKDTQIILDGKPIRDKTDHMLPADHGSKEAFHARLEQQYGNQLEIYKAVLQELTGKPVKEAMLLSI